MNISKYDFTQFSKEKWQEIIDIIDKGSEVENVIPYRDIVCGIIVPSVTVEYSYLDDDFDVCSNSYRFTTFEVEHNGQKLDNTSKKWRKIMIKEFGDNYYAVLIAFLKNVKTQKIQQAEEEYIQEVEEINNL